MNLENKFVNKRTTAVLYSCGTCNLKCHYCGIDKNPILAKIDEELGKSFEGDYYINQFQKYFPNPHQLTRLETWGGEPFLKMERMYPLVNQVIQKYPYFKEMFSSTNFSYPEWPDKFFGLMKQFAPYAPRQFEYYLQLSLDGPTEINDFNRGAGVTERCRKNFEIFVERLKTELPENVVLKVHFKPTLDMVSMRQLDTKEKIIEYYQFFEGWYKPLFDLQMERVKPEISVPNTAVPSPVTKDDGIFFGQLCKMCKEIEMEDLTEHYFQYYRSITPYADFRQKCMYASYHDRSCLCGTGSSLLGFLPNGLMSTCHEGFTNMYEEYKKLSLTSTREEEGATINFDKYISEKQSKYCLTEEEYAEYEKYIDLYDVDGTKAKTVNTVGVIMALAAAGQIDQKYLDEVEANNAAQFIATHTSYCIKDNYNVTGSFITIPVGLPKLLLNGAREYIEDRREDEIKFGGKTSNG